MVIIHRYKFINILLPQHRCNNYAVYSFQEGWAPNKWNRYMVNTYVYADDNHSHSNFSYNQ